MVAIATCYKLEDTRSFLWDSTNLQHYIYIYLTTVYSRDWVGCQRNMPTDLPTGRILSFILCREVLPRTEDDKSER